MKRRLLIVALFLGLGAVLNVAVAWACAIWPPVCRDPSAIPSQHPPEVLGGAKGRSARQPGYVDTASGFGYTEYFTGISMRSNVASPAANNDRLGSTGRTDPWTLWSPYTDPQAATAGWPLRALDWSIRKHAAGRSSIYREGLRLPDTMAWLGVAPDRRVPLRPLWLGFAVNTLFFAIVAASVWTPIVALRRYSRRRHGQCPACGYPVGVSAVCTECGRAVSPRADSSEPDSSHIPLD